MGVFRLFRHLTKRYPTAVIDYKDTNKYVKKGQPRNPVVHTYGTEACLIDLNAFIHPVCQQVYEYGEGEKNKSVFWSNKKKEMSSEDLEQMAFNLICKKITELVEMTKPSKYIYVAVDGVCGSSKAYQQRQRRFKSSPRDSNKYFGFDPNCITTGTEFMDRLCKHIYFFIRKKKNYDWKGMLVFYSDVSCPGEGEHKLVRWVESNKVKSCTIISPDADLIMLSLTLKVPQIYIFRENVYRDNPADYFFVDIRDLKKCILKDIYYVDINRPFVEEDALKDYVFFTFLIGNDFLPHIHSLEITNQGIDILYKCYMDTIIEHGNLIEEKAKKILFRKDAIVSLMKNLASLETKMLLDKYENVRVSFPDKLVQKHILKTTKGNNINFEAFRKDYYLTKMKLDEEYLEREVMKVCGSYMKTMMYICRYYFIGIPTFSWMYEYCYSPLLSDLYKYCSMSKLEYNFDVHRPLSKAESLLGILPLQSFYLLPHSIRETLENKLMMDSDFNCEVNIDLDGCVNDYEGKLILPVVKYEKLQHLFSLVNLTESEKKRNMVGSVYKF
jgi:5'-3' exoribonuclease 2